MNPALHTAVLAMLLMTAAVALWSRRLSSSVSALCVFNLLLSLEFFLLKAPDVAIATAVIGGVLTPAVFIIVLWLCQKRSDRSKT